MSMGRVRISQTHRVSASHGAFAMKGEILSGRDLSSLTRMSAGLKFGMYSDAGERTCLGYPGVQISGASKPHRSWNIYYQSPKVHGTEGS